MTTITERDSVAEQAPAIRPFRVEVPEADLDDLRRRIAATRWPDRETVPDRSQGAQLAELQELVRYWGTDYDWRKAEAQTERLPAVHDDHRRGRRPLHPRPLAPPERAAADRHARVAGLGLRADQDHRSAHRSDGVRRSGGGRLRRRDPVPAGLRLLVATDRDRLGVGAHRPCVGRAHEAAGLHALRRAGRRLGRRPRRGDGAAGAGGTARHPHQPAGGLPARRRRRDRQRRPRAGGPLREGTRGVRRPAWVPPERRLGVPDDDELAAAGRRLRPDGLPRRPRGVHARARRVRRSGPTARTRPSRRRETRCWTTSRCTG